MHTLKLCLRLSSLEIDELGVCRLPVVATMVANAIKPYGVLRDRNGLILHGSGNSLCRPWLTLRYYSQYLTAVALVSYEKRGKLKPPLPTVSIRKNGNGKTRATFQAIGHEAFHHTQQNRTAQQIDREASIPSLLPVLYYVCVGNGQLCRTFSSHQPLLSSFSTPLT